MAKSVANAPPPGSGSASPRGGRFNLFDVLFAAGAGFVLARAHVAQRERALADDLGLPDGAVEADNPLDPAAEPNRGRDAVRPSEFPRKGWTDILWRLLVSFFGDRLPSVAGGVAFFILLSIFPAIASFVSLYGLMADVNAVREQLESMRGVFPPDVLNILGEQMERVATSRKAGLSFAFAGSLLVALWSVMGGVKALFQGLNVAYHESERRNLLKVNLLALYFTLGGLVFVTVVVGAVIVTPVAFSVFGINGDGMGLLRWPVLFAMNVIALAVLYRYGPSRAAPRWRWVTWGSCAASALWLGASVAFSWYLANVANFQATYGSLGAFMAFWFGSGSPPWWCWSEPN
jgi:membrane protein